MPGLSSVSGWRVAPDRSLRRAHKLGDSASGWELVAVDAADTAGLRALAAGTRVLATTVGPFTAYGKEVARAFAEEGTHYADITGEVLFVRWSLDELDARERRPVPRSSTRVGSTPSPPTWAY
jgi:short subunit dehydrogenase-like uncharacterized protein